VIELTSRAANSSSSDSWDTLRQCQRAYIIRQTPHKYLLTPRMPIDVQMGPLEFVSFLYGKQGSEGSGPAEECMWELPDEAR
jgi:hypothetical protein